jgi:hypothetical protein
MILDLHQRVLTVSAISRETGIREKRCADKMSGPLCSRHGPRKPVATVIML